MKDRLTKRTDEELEELEGRLASSLTFNELLALAGQRLEDKSSHARRVPHSQVSGPLDFDSIDAGRDCSKSHTHLEDALTSYNSACYRIKGTWKRADPDRMSES